MGRSCEEGSKSVYNVSGEGVGVSLLRCKSGVVGDNGNAVLMALITEIKVASIIPRKGV
jgi:hypothetical protein